MCLASQPKIDDEQRPVTPKRETVGVVDWYAELLASRTIANQSFVLWRRPFKTRVSALVYGKASTQLALVRKDNPVQYRSSVRLDDGNVHDRPDRPHRRADTGLFDPAQCCSACSMKP